MKKLIISIMLSAGMALGATSVSAQDYVLSTASTGGTYHPVGVAISTLSKIKLLPKEKFSLTAVNSAGSGANLQALASGNADFAILQGLFGKYAAEGSGPVAKPQKNLRSVSMLWQNVEQFIIVNDLVKTGTVSDIVNAKGVGAGFGKQNSGTFGANKTLLNNLGLDIEKDFDLLYAGYGPTADAMINGQIKAIGMGAGPPTGAVTKLLASAGDKVTLLNITDEELKAMDNGRQLWTRYVIPAGTYPGQDADLQTAAQPNFLGVNASISEEHVYLLTKAIYENLVFLNSIHPATKVMSPETAMAGLPAPLHPGALRYYKEIGLNVPAHLIAN
jgi:TRAP transporter TAXI family solute receptor